MLASSVVARTNSAREECTFRIITNEWCSWSCKFKWIAITTLSAKYKRVSKFGGSFQVLVYGIIEREAEPK